MALIDKLTAIANAIRGKTGKTDGLTLDQMATEIADLKSGGTLQEKTVTPKTSAQTVTPDSGYDGLSKVTVNAMSAATQATPTISVSSAGLITASAEQSEGYVASGTKSATKQLTTQAAKTVTPTTSAQTAVASGTFATGDVKVAGDANLIASNIKSGTTIFGVSGSYKGVRKNSFTTTFASEREINSTSYTITGTNRGYTANGIIFWLETSEAIALESTSSKKYILALTKLSSSSGYDVLVKEADGTFVVYSGVNEGLSITFPSYTQITIKASKSTGWYFAPSTYRYQIFGS